MNKFIKVFAFCALLSGCFGDDYNTTFKTLAGDVNYNLEVAIKAEDQSRGLMERDSLAADGGMLFPIAPTQPVTMWMRNTKISLDIIFIGADNRIVKIIRRAEPMSIKYLTSDFPVKAVIEINGGDADKHKIEVGQYIKSSALEKFEADYKTLLDAKKAALEKEATAEKSLETTPDSKEATPASDSATKPSAQESTANEAKEGKKTEEKK